MSTQGRINILEGILQTEIENISQAITEGGGEATIERARIAGLAGFAFIQVCASVVLHLHTIQNEKEST